ncbi:MAG: NAD(P)-dependent oxidoreductase, partial [Halobaculum sp.]
MTRVLLTGANCTLARRFAAAAPDAWTVVGTVRDGATAPVDTTRMDLRERESVVETVSRTAPDVIVHVAACTDVDLCEREPELARAVNDEGTAAVAAGARRTGARVVYVSTPYVFDGTDGPDDERAVPSPINVYGRTKRAGECHVRSLSDAVTVRFG